MICVNYSLACAYEAIITNCKVRYFQKTQFRLVQSTIFNSPLNKVSFSPSSFGGATYEASLSSPARELDILVSPYIRGVIGNYCVKHTLFTSQDTVESGLPSSYQY